jgi:hypothetical protein
MVSIEIIGLSVYSAGSNQFPSREGIRGVLKLVIGRNYNTPPSPSREGSQVQPVDNLNSSHLIKYDTSITII